VCGLAFGQVGMNPEPVAGQKIGRFADGEGKVSALDVHVHFRPGKVEGRIVGV